MKRRFVDAAACAALVAGLTLCPDSGRADVSRPTLTVETRTGVTVKVLVFKPQAPAAIAVLFKGGTGKMGQRTNRRGFTGFLSGNAERFAEHGLLVALLDAPSDQQGPEGMSPWFRSGRHHVTDTDAVIARLKREADLPVWLIGVSRGTISAANVAANSRHRLGGLVLASSSAGKRGPSITRMELGKITAPILLVAHVDDGCRGTPPEGARIITRKLTNAPVAELKLFSGGRTEGRNPCGPGTPHTFHGIQEKVVKVIADFVMDRSR